MKNTVSLLVIFIFLKGPQILAASDTGGFSTHDKSTSEDVQAPQCGPIGQEFSSLEVAQMAMTCSPVFLEAGFRASQTKVVGALVSKHATKLVKFAGIRFASYLVGGVGIAVTGYDVIKYMRNYQPEACDSDLEFKQKMIGKIESINVELIKAAEGEITEKEKKNLQFSPRLKNKRVLSRIPCSQLRNTIEAKIRIQRKVWTGIRQSYKILPKKKQRIKAKIFPGVHGGKKGHRSPELENFFQELLEMAKTASCLPLHQRANIACATGEIILMGSVSIKELKQLKEKMAEIKRLQNSVIGQKSRSLSDPNMPDNLWGIKEEMQSQGIRTKPWKKNDGFQFTVEADPNSKNFYERLAARAENRGFKEN